MSHTAGAGSNMRRATAALAVLSALVAVLAVFGWVASDLHRVQADAHRFVGPNADHMVYFSLDNSHGTLGVSFASQFGHFGGRWPGWRYSWDSPPQGPLYSLSKHARRTVLDRLGVHLLHQTWSGGNLDNYVIECRYWIIVALAGTATVLFRRRSVAAHAKPATCAACGYDLRGTPDRCPECGRTAGAG